MVGVYKNLDFARIWLIGRVSQEPVQVEMTTFLPPLSYFRLNLDVDDTCTNTSAITSVIE